MLHLHDERIRRALRQKALFVGSMRQGVGLATERTAITDAMTETQMAFREVSPAAGAIFWQIDHFSSNDTETSGLTWDFFLLCHVNDTP
jgi:hypothetical protein